MKENITMSFQTEFKFLLLAVLLGFGIHAAAEGVSWTDDFDRIGFGRWQKMPENVHIVPKDTLSAANRVLVVSPPVSQQFLASADKFIGGDVDSFVNRMNLRAQTLGMTNSHFVSPCGLPDKKKGNSLSCARDMVVLAEQLLEYPDVMRWSTTKQDFIREGEKKTMLTTTNKLVNPRWPGVDGLKTGFINASGYCLTFSVLRDGRRIVGCVTGFKSARDRDRFSRKLIDWGYARAAVLK